MNGKLGLTALALTAACGMSYDLDGDLDVTHHLDWGKCSALCDDVKAEMQAIGIEVEIEDYDGEGRAVGVEVSLEIPCKLE
tara:strand:+ start:185 stop:427 length:243 start_codon:yes stop_codon:yes gene_type:complete